MGGYTPSLPQNHLALYSKFLNLDFRFLTHNRGLCSQVCAHVMHVTWGEAAKVYDYLIHAQV